MSNGVQITRISRLGIWLQAHDKKWFLSYGNFPWFKDKPVRAIENVCERTRGHFYWPDIDIDLDVELIEHPGKYPLRRDSGIAI